MNYGYGYIILDLGPELSARFHHSRTHSIRAGTHWMKKNRKGKKKKKKVGYIFFLALNTDLGQAHFIACMHIIFPPLTILYSFHLRPSLPTHPRPSWRLAKADVGGLGYFISPSRRMTISSFISATSHATHHVSLVYYLIFHSVLVYCMYASKLSKIPLVGCIKVIYTGIYIYRSFVGWGGGTCVCGGFHLWIMGYCCVLGRG